MSYIRILQVNVASLLCLFSFASFAITDVSSPGVLDRTGETYRLVQDVVADGTAFSIRGSDITFDLNGHTITYNDSPSEQPVAGVHIDSLSDRIRVTNGYIVQGGGLSLNSHAIVMMGGGSVQGPSIFSYLVIRTYADATGGIHASHDFSFRKSSIHHVYIRSTGNATSTAGDGVTGIYISSDVGEISVTDNVIVDSHRGIGVARLGIAETSPAVSTLRNNLIQVRRSPGAKAPYGIMVAKSRNVMVRQNQIVSDQGRGIILDGWGQGTNRGSDFNEVSGNLIDVQYTQTAVTGSYIENNVYGVRDRYSSGNNLFTFNDIIVSTTTSGVVYGFYIGSDATDPLMTDINVSNNRILVRRGNAGPTDASVFKFDYAISIAVSENGYQTDGDVVQYHWSGANFVDELVMSNNQEIRGNTEDPVAPSAVSITQFLDSYLLKWNRSVSSDVMEYVVYRDGERLPISPRGGHFYVDTDVSGEHTYSVTALSLAGIESSPSSTVSTRRATIGWWGTRPNPPQSLSPNP